MGNINILIILYIDIEPGIWFDFKTIFYYILLGERKVDHITTIRQLIYTIHTIYALYIYTLTA